MSISIENPKKSPSLDQFGKAVVIDENSNRIPLKCVVFPSVTGATGLPSAKILAKGYSQVTGLEQAPQAVNADLHAVEVEAIMSIDPATGKPAAFSAPLAAKVTGKFQSTVLTASGSEISTAHGLGVTPSLVLVAPYDNTAAGSTPFAFAVSEGTHDATNVKVTGTSGLKYKVIAFA